MRDAWHDEGFAQRWDAEDALRTNPDREAQIDLLVALLAESFRDGDRLLDLGVGSGLVEEALFERLPDIHVIGVDHSEAMLAQARTRHRGRTNLRLVDGGFENLDAMVESNDLGPPFEFMTCVQALHEVTDDVKRAVFAFARRHIAPRGLFLVLDRFDYEPFALAPEYRCIWKRLNRCASQEHAPEGPAPEGHAVEGHAPETPLSFEEYRARYAAKIDHVGAVEDYLRWMREAGFDAACLYQQFNRALIAARPKTG